MAECYCEKCKRTMKPGEFYTTNNFEKYPEGRVRLCKRCLTMHIDNWDPDTYLWILQECDVPYMPEEWNILLGKYGQDKSKVTGSTIIGRYLAKMKLKQWKDYRWKDTAFLQELANNKAEAAMKLQGLEAVEIRKEIEYRNSQIPVDIETKLYEPPQVKMPTLDDSSHSFISQNAPADYFDQENGEAENALIEQLTEEDKTFLRLKWGKAYRQEEWVRLEQLYQEMMQSYDIQGAGHEDVLKLVCKTSLKANQLLDIGDVDGAQKMVKMYDSLMKSGRFTAAQNKVEEGEYLDSISEFVEICEKEGFIPRYYSEQPNDKVDETLLDLKAYTHSLVINEMNLGNLIEGAVKEMARLESQEEDEDMEDDETIQDTDYDEFNDFIVKEQEENEY